ncbi:FtsX-like permease family protein [Phenylobacterium sp.]|uniref:cell division protein FtsX n=1 Tax=Phenylobacterium sp. TaxID=1871053 RepID=UPI0025CD8751|nr:FtsX-like permease family protein [Phenylobacterium sp.]MBX3482573.1 ABC transporter permease [Phenylobacterium sp.]
MSEPFDPQRWKPASFLPDAEARDPALIFVIAVLCFLACLMGLGVIAGSRAAQGWASQLTGEATVIVRARGGETPDAAAARAAEALASVAGVTEARALEKEKAYALIKPWLGDVSDLDDLPVPRLVAVGLDDRKPATAQTLDKALKAQGIDAVVDDHSVWIKDIKRAAGVVKWTAAAIFLLIAGAAGAVVAFATRAGIAARRDVVEVLHLTGAEDAQIASLFEMRFARIAAISGAAGAVAAAGLGAVLRLMGGAQGITPALPVGWVDLLAVTPCPVGAALVAAVAARITARRLIQRL